MKNLTSRKIEKMGVVAAMLIVWALLAWAAFFLLSGCNNCDDNDLCTYDYLDASTGNCIYEARNCDDGKPWTDDFCLNGECRHPFVNCDDGLRCTIDGVDSNGICFFVPIANCTETCDNPDNDPCTVDTITNGMLLCNWPKNCDDGNPCTNDFCLFGPCEWQPVDCDDGDPLTADWCDSTNVIEPCRNDTLVPMFNPNQKKLFAL